MRPPTTTLDLDYVPPLDWHFFLRYLGNRATPGVEAVTGKGYVRTIDNDGRPGTLTVSHHPSEFRLIVEIQSESEVPVERIIGRVRRIFDLDTDMRSVHRTLGDDPFLKPLLAAAPGIRIPGAWSSFELLVRTIVGQQVSVKSATTIMGRLVSRLGTPLAERTTGELSHLFPAPREIANANLEAIGMPSSRVIALQRVARAVTEGLIPVSYEHAVVPDVRNALLSLPGIGPWTVEYFALRALRDADAWPVTDLILRRAVERITAAAASPHSQNMTKWSPFRGYAAMHLWNEASQTTQKTNK